MTWTANPVGIADEHVAITCASMLTDLPEVSCFERIVETMRTTTSMILAILAAVANL